MLTEQLTTRLAAADAFERESATDVAMVQAVLARQLLAALRLPRERDGGAKPVAQQQPLGKHQTKSLADKHEAPTGSNAEDCSDGNDNQNDDRKN
ncbi:hypothetical protein [Cupriavidus alkaliphilus]|uniref:hypothetical protein n=1 Tax=Cupriavidus alkaliphilus TaxID=942866 RepID=UPI00339D9673